LIDSARTIRGTYDKRRLVPFAEYDPLAGDAGSSPDPEAIAYTAGGVASVLEAGRLRVGTMICYEVLFPQLARDAVRAGADVLVNLSNDTWLDAGDGAAREQHFSMSVFRAIETRRPLVRAAASGISGFVSPYGKAYSLLPAETAGVAVAPVVPGSGETPYVRWGDTWVWLGGALVLFALARGKRDD
jgi:apolipoprotein N-acyltransferase